MLVLTRKLNESVVLTGGITVTVVHIDRGKIRLAFEAPEHIKIARSELLMKVHSGDRDEKSSDGGEAV